MCKSQMMLMKSLSKRRARRFHIVVLWALQLLALFNCVGTFLSQGAAENTLHSICIHTRKLTRKPKSTR